MKKILVVDDNSSFSYCYQRMFSNRYQLVEASEGLEGLEKAFSERPDLIITDSEMPVIDGYEMIRRLREDNRTMNIPILGVGYFDTDKVTLEGFWRKPLLGSDFDDIEKRADELLMTH